MTGWKDIAAIVIASLSFIVSALSFTIARLNARNAIRPVVVFEYVGTEGWTAQNIGSGPALNMIVAMGIDNNWSKPVRTPPLAKDGSVVLTWTRRTNIHRLGALYEDANGHSYTTVCALDLNQISRGRRFGPWPESHIGKHWANGEVVPPLV
jgi:hypothetical protein